MLEKLVKDEKGYGTVELLILVAALGVLATGLMVALQDTLTGENGVVEGLNEKVKSIMGEWGVGTP